MKLLLAAIAALVLAAPASGLTIDYTETPTAISIQLDGGISIDFEADAVFSIAGTTFALDFAAPGVELEPDPGDSLTALEGEVYEVDLGATVVRITPTFEVPELGAGGLAALGMTGLIWAGRPKHGARTE